MFEIGLFCRHYVELASLQALLYVDSMNKKPGFDFIDTILISDVEAFLLPSQSLNDEGKNYLELLLFVLIEGTEVFAWLDFSLN